jgi:hypothetical protein
MLRQGLGTGGPVAASTPQHSATTPALKVCFLFLALGVLSAHASCLPCLLSLCAAGDRCHDTDANRRWITCAAACGDSLRARHLRHCGQEDASLLPVWWVVHPQWSTTTSCLPASAPLTAVERLLHRLAPYLPRLWSLPQVTQSTLQAAWSQPVAPWQYRCQTPPGQHYRVLGGRVMPAGSHTLLTPKGKGSSQPGSGLSSNCDGSNCQAGAVCLCRRRICCDESRYPLRLLSRQQSELMCLSDWA